MNMKYKTPQEEFWAGNFGDEYISRNKLEEMAPARLTLFSKILARTRNVNSVLEFGANIGTNLYAIHQLLPKAEIKAVEINPVAAKTLKSYQWIDSAIEGSFTSQDFNNEADLTFTSGVLIHLNPDMLPKAYENLYKGSRKYILICEYYNPSPVTVPYRDHQDRLFKRDFAGEMMDKYQDLELLDYGFAYRRDPNHPMDDLTWFLMKKKD
jgi:spore coat polysaccharide biosynthesis protein SpsF